MDHAPRVGFEPTTLILTGFRATAAPPGIVQLSTSLIISRVRNLRKVDQSCVDLAMTIGTYENTFRQLLRDFCPAFCQVALRQAELFCQFINMVKIKRGQAT